MKKVTQENIKELATNLLDSVGKQSFNQGKIYYKDGYVKLSIKPLDAELYVDDVKTKEFYAMAADAVANRQKGKYKDYLILFSKHKAELDSVKEIDEIKRVYNLIHSNLEGLKQSLTHYRKVSLGHTLLNPTNGNQLESYNKFKDAIEILGYTVSTYANEPKFYVFPLRSFGADSLKHLINAYNLVERYPLPNLIETMKKDWSHEQVTDFIEVSGIYSQFLAKYGDLPEKADKVIHLMGEYEKSMQSGFNLQIIKRIKSMGYEPLQIVIVNGEVIDFSIYPNSRDGLFLPEIRLSGERVGNKKLRIQTTSVGSLTSDELKSHLSGYQVAMSIVDILEHTNDMYYIADYD